jgi:hypothetical protein
MVFSSLHSKEKAMCGEFAAERNLCLMCLLEAGIDLIAREHAV